eukprot:763811-Hanusia_phi.AAC.3
MARNLRLDYCHREQTQTNKCSREESHGNHAIEGSSFSQSRLPPSKREKRICMKGSYSLYSFSWSQPNLYDFARESLGVSSKNSSRFAVFFVDQQTNQG